MDNERERGMEREVELGCVRACVYWCDRGRGGGGGGVSEGGRGDRLDVRGGDRKRWR